MPSLAFLAPSPRLVRLGAGEYLVGELRMGDLAELDDLREARRPDPLAGVADLLEAESVAPGDRGRVSAAFDAADAEPDTDFGAEVYHFVRVALRRHHPEMDGVPLIELLRSMTPADHAGLRRAAYRTPPLEALTRALNRWSGAPGPGTAEADWPRLVEHVARTHGYTYPEIAEMTRTQFVVALSEGKPPSTTAGEAWSLKRCWDRWFAGVDEPKGGA